MKVLIFSAKKYFREEVRDFFQSEKIELLSAHSLEEAIDIFFKNKIDIFLFNIDSLEEVELLRYINKYYQEVKVFILTNNFLHNAISILRNGNYRLVENPFKIQELKNLIAK